MKSIQGKITILTVSAIVATLILTTLLSVYALKKSGDQSSEQLLYLLCRTGEKNLDSYFEDVEHSVKLATTLIQRDITGLESDQLKEHMERATAIFQNTAESTKGVLTYYYRLDPTVSDTEKGFWYMDLDGKGFREHEVTDITKYDLDDTTNLVWFTVPRATGKGIWQPPYFTDSLNNVLVFSYNAPVYYQDTFIGVVGIEIDYSVISEQVKNITLYDEGYAFINDSRGKIICHPTMSVEELTGEVELRVPDNLLDEAPSVRYTYNGVEKLGVWLPLSNGMRLYVTVPTSVIDRTWHQLLMEIVLVSLALLLVFSFLTLRFARHITKPLTDLTKAAEQVNEGNYEVKLNYEKKDEIGILSNTFNGLIGHLKVYIGDLNNLVYADALTSIHNKGAFDVYVKELQDQIDSGETKPEFAIGIFDCDDLKQINDKYGHYAGDIYIKSASHYICRMFSHSPVFRIGGDEFAVILQDEDYQMRAEITKRVEENGNEIHIVADRHRIPVRVSMGISDFDPETDQTVDDVVKRADKIMYENKRMRKGIVR